MKSIKNTKEISEAIDQHNKKQAAISQDEIHKRLYAVARLISNQHIEEKRQAFEYFTNETAGRQV